MTDQPQPVQLNPPKPTLSPEQEANALASLANQAKVEKDKLVNATKAHHALATDLFGIGEADFRLPAGGVLDGVIYDQVYIREMTGVEEDMMANADLEVLERMERVSAACVTKIVSRADPTKQITDPDMIRQMISGTLPTEQGYPFTSADRIALLLFIRRATVGDLYKYEVTCPHTGCGFKNRNKALQLDEIEISYNPHPEKRRVGVKLPKSGLDAVVRVLDGAGEKKAAMLKPGTEDYGSLAIMVRLESIDGHLLSSMRPEEQLELVKRMPRVDREYLRKVYQKIEGVVDTDVELTCKKCQKDIAFPLDLGQVFSSTLEDSVSDSDLEWL